MSPIEWLVRGLAPLVRRRWGDECPAGAPVPAVERCTAVDCDSVRLTALAEGEHARVTCLEAPGSAEARRLASLGILPGVELVLLQRTPAFVLRVGYTDLALDTGLAERVRVRRDA
jgi:DtxR family Mn-dependent transcriptional regulator